MTTKQAEKLAIGATVKLTDRAIKEFPEREQSYRASKRGAVRGFKQEHGIGRVVMLSWGNEEKQWAYEAKHIAVAND